MPVLLNTCVSNTIEQVDPATECCTPRLVGRGRGRGGAGHRVQFSCHGWICAGRLVAASRVHTTGSKHTPPAPTFRSGGRGIRPYIARNFEARVVEVPKVSCNMRAMLPEHGGQTNPGGTGELQKKGPPLMVREPFSCVLPARVGCRSGGYPISSSSLSSLLFSSLQVSSWPLSSSQGSSS